MQNSDEPMLKHQVYNVFFEVCSSIAQITMLNFLVFESFFVLLRSGTQIPTKN